MSKSKNKLLLSRLQNAKDKIPNFKFIYSALIILFFGSLFLTIWEVSIYRNTFIPFLIPFLIWIFTGLIITPFLRKFLETYFLTPYLLLQIFFNIVTWGGIVLFIFMWTNYHFASKNTFIKNAEIISTGHFPRSKHDTCEQPYIIINYNGNEKQLVYLCNTQVELYKSVDLLVAKGLFSYDILVRSILKNN